MEFGRRESLLGAPGYTARLVNMEVFPGDLKNLNGTLVWPEKLPDTQFLIKIPDDDGTVTELKLPARHFEVLGEMADPNEGEEGIAINIHSLRDKYTVLQQQIRKIAARPEGLQSVKDAFLKFDTDKSGTLDKTEFIIGLRSLGIDFSNRDCALLWPVLDSGNVVCSRDLYALY